jgi:hypothetical protein
MTPDLGHESSDGRKKSPAQLALLRAIQEKIDEIKIIEGRLGTPSELPTDLDRAQELAHRINNLLTTYRLGKDLGDGGTEI